MAVTADITATVGEALATRPMTRVTSRTTGTGTEHGTRGVHLMNLKTVTWALALSASSLYLLCIAYGLTRPATGHMVDFLTIVLPGFEWLTVKGFVIGLVKSFLYGALLGLVYVPIYNVLARRFEH
jgi:hypothetical protein